MTANHHAREVMSTLEARRTASLLDTDLGVRASWERCVTEHGLRPDRVDAPEVLSYPELLVRRAGVEELDALSTAEVDRLFQRLASHAQVIMMTNHQGVVINYRCSDSVLDQCRTMRILPGSIWSEESQGTTGVSLCLREQRPVSVVMSEHFATKLAGLSCTVAPIFGAEGQLACALNLTSVQSADHSLHRLLRDMVSGSARRIENHYFDRRHQRNRILRLSRHDDFLDSAAEARLAVDDSGQIIDATPQAIELLDGAATVRHVPELVGRRLASLVSVHDVDHIFQEAGVTLIGACGPIHIRPAELTRPRSAIRVNNAGPITVRAAGTLHRDAPTMTDAIEPTLSDLAGCDPTAARQLDIARRVHARGLPLLLQGESGTGKTRFARALHDAGPYHASGFVAINCASIPRELIESELFGYRAGSFTGAGKNGSPGRLLGANGGTLFLDEIGDMPLSLQGRLLQVLSGGEFVPVGAIEPVRVRFALVSATLHDLAARVRDGQFREDLYFRISGATLSLQALRHRADRLDLIERAFVQAGSESDPPGHTLTDAARDLLDRYGWPGNFRELHHVARFACAISETPQIEPDCLPAPLGNALQSVANISSGAASSRCASNRPTDGDPAIVKQMLTDNGWNVSAAAHRLGVSRATLHRRLNAFGLSRPIKPAT